MNIAAIWNLFAKTGDPRFYLLYRLLSERWLRRLYRRKFPTITCPESELLSGHAKAI